MQISFDPRNRQECSDVLDTIRAIWPTDVVEVAAAQGAAIVQTFGRTEPQSAAPLAPPAPSSADVAPPPTVPAVIEGFVPPAPTDAAPPVPAAPPAVVHMAAAAPTTHVSGAEVDIHGMPWDGRIHSESRAKLADGSWRRRRNTPDEVVTQVEAELRAAMGGAPAPLAPPAPASSAPASAPIPSAPPVPAAPTAAAPSAPVTGGSWTFPAVVQAVNQRVQAGKLANDGLNAALVIVGLQAGQLVKLAGATPETLAAFMQAIDNA